MKKVQKRHSGDAGSSSLKATLANALFQRYVVFERYRATPAN
nr:unnamed protein product [Callosobruchus analis]